MGAPDGTLFDWRELSSRYEWDTLLLGNGMSINLWEPFGYRVLFDKAKADHLSTEELRLFQSTPNFERVLGDLLTAMRVNQALGVPTGSLLQRYRNIQRTLASAIRAVHINREGVPLSSRRQIRIGLVDYEWVFTTSYDLILYWAIGCEGFRPFIDLGRRLEADAGKSRVPAQPIRQADQG